MVPLGSIGTGCRGPVAARDASTASPAHPLSYWRAVSAPDRSTKSFDGPRGAAIASSTATLPTARRRRQRTGTTIEATPGNRCLVERQRFEYLEASSRSTEGGDGSSDVEQTPPSSAPFLLATKARARVCFSFARVTLCACSFAHVTSLNALIS